MSMDFSSRLLLLLDVVDLGSFTDASERRNVNRSVISKQISKLESELGVRLLNRTTRSLSLTTAGHQMVKQAISLRDLLNETQALAQNYHAEPKGVLRITSSSYFGREYVQKAILLFQRKYPDVEIELRLEDRTVDIVAEGYDIGFRTGKPKDSTLVARNIARNRLLIVASPEFIERYGEPSTISDLEQLPAVVYSTTGLLIDKVKYFDKSGAEASIKLHAAYKVSELDMLTNTAIAGNMLSLVTAQMINNEVLEGQLVPIMTDLNLADYGTFYAVYPHRDSPIKTRLFIDTLKEIIGEGIPAWEKRIPGFNKMYGRSED
ncbi:LysR family transcriptional regulator [Aliamphritea ceti]|uniref:LysR family transcriptional regulator n=1 Tax=Aliamphritea ceti TaxID=1524258 RepID=UPI0021C2D4EA|nr:LysR family transcriptional regulator [Aliamphritea ceti]